MKQGQVAVEHHGVYAIDPGVCPDIYRTNNPAYHGRWCIDYAPESVPTIASFATGDEALAWLQDKHGLKQLKQWFGWRVQVVNGKAEFRMGAGR